MTINFSNINSAAQLIWKKLDDMDGTDNSISKSVWVKFQGTGVNARSIRWCIKEENALKSIKYYLKNANETVKQNIANLCGLTIETSETKETPETAEIPETKETPETVKPSEIKETTETVEAAETEQTQTWNTKQQETIEIANKIKGYLQNTEIDFDTLDTDFKKDLVNKYKNITAMAQANNFELSEEQISERIRNYAKGYLFHKFESGNVLGTNNEDYQSDCSKAKNYEELRESYQQFGKEYVEFGDADGNGKFGVHEMFYQELTEYYQTKGMNKQEATKKAIETTRKFKEYNIENLPDENNSLYGTEEMDLFVKVLGKITTLDADGDQELSADESGAYLMSMAQLDDSKNNITAQENIRTEYAVNTNGMSVEDIMEEYNLDRKTAENIISYQKKFNNNLAAYQDFIINGKMPGS